MDLHPLVVHFPIALLTLYSFLEVIKPWTKAPHWKNIRLFLIITGAIGAYLGLMTGEVAEDLYTNPGMRDVLDAHEAAGSAAAWVYIVLAVGYFFDWLRTSRLSSKVPTAVRKWIDIAVKLIVKSPLAPLLAIAGFLILSLAGALGAILVHGPDIDFITKIVYNVMFGGK